MKYKNVIFDMDGVLIDNSEGIMSCARYAIAELGLPVPSDEVLRKFIGPALIWSLKTYCGATDEQAERGLNIYRARYLKGGVKMFRLYDGIYDTVKTLCENGVRCSVCSGKPQDSVEEILKTAGMTDFFEIAVGTVFPARVSSKDEQMKTAVLERPALMVGDRVFDLECAFNAHVDCVYATYGFGEPDDLKVYKPTYVANEPKDIIEIVLKQRI